MVEKQEPFNDNLTNQSSALACSGSNTFNLLMLRLDAMQDAAVSELIKQGFSSWAVQSTRFLNCRYQGTDTAIMTSLPSAVGPEVHASAEAYENQFKDIYRREYGFELEGRSILVDDIRVRAVGRSNVGNACAATGSAGGAVSGTETPEKRQQLVAVRDELLANAEIANVYFDGGRRPTPVLRLTQLPPFLLLDGPAIIVQDVATVILEPGCTAYITSTGDIEISVIEACEKNVTTELDPIYMSIFSHRFMGIAEQMGRTLQVSDSNRSSTPLPILLP